MFSVSVSVASLAPEAPASGESIFSDDPMVKNANFFFFMRFYVIISFSCRNKTQRKELSFEYRVRGLWSAANRANGNCSCGWRLPGRMPCHIFIADERRQGDEASKDMSGLE